MKSNRVLIVAGIGILAVAVAAAILASRDEATFEPGTPEATVQTFVNAYLDGDATLAQAQLSDECSPLDMRWRERSARVSLLESRDDDGTAVVRVRVTTGDSELFDAPSWTRDEEYQLVQTDSGWVIDRSTWPFIDCHSG